MKIRDFSQTFAQALSAANAQAIADVYAEQFIMTSPDAYEIVKTDVAFLERASKFYQSIGVKTVKIKTYEETDLGSSHTLVKVNWGYNKEDESEIINFDVTYVVKQFPTGPKIIFFIAHNEKDRLIEKGLLPRS